MRSKKVSGPSGKHLVPKRNLRAPDELWARFAGAAESQGLTRQAVLVQLMEEYCRRHLPRG